MAWLWWALIEKHFLTLILHGDLLISVLILQPTHMAEFAQVQSIYTVSGDDGKGLLQLKIAGAAEPLTITCSCLDIAEDMADLIDGYCRFVHDVQKTLWTRKGKLLVKAVSAISWHD